MHCGPGSLRFPGEQKVQSLGLSSVGLSPNSETKWLCDLGQILSLARSVVFNQGYTLETWEAGKSTGC